MNRNEQIKNLQELLKDATSRLNHSVQRDGTPDEYWAQNVVSLTAAIQALKAQDAAEPERPKSREAKLLDTLCEAVCSAQNQYDRDIAASLIQAWRANQVITDPLVTALLAPKLAWAKEYHYGASNLYATMLRVMIPDVCPGACQPPEEDDANDQT